MVAMSSIGHQPSQLGPDSLVFCSSNTGATEDTLAALRFAKQRGARTVAVCVREGSALVKGADAAVVFPKWGEFAELSPLLVGLNLKANIADEDLAVELRDGLEVLPEALRQAVSREGSRSEEQARELLSATHLYVVASGVLTGLGLQVRI